MAQSNLDRADELKRQLAELIIQRMREQKLTQRAAAQTIGISRSKIIEMKSGKTASVSLERLLGALERLGEPVKVTVGQGPRAVEVHYETDEERYVRLNGKEHIPDKYLFGFTVHLARDWAVEISPDRETWEQWRLVAEDDISDEKQSLEVALKSMIYTFLSDTEYDWRRRVGAVVKQMRHIYFDGDLKKSAGRASRAIKQILDDTESHRKMLKSFHPDDDSELKLLDIISHQQK